MKTLVVAIWVAAGAWVWSQRECGRPLLDLYQAWHDCGYQEPPELPHLDGTVVRVLAPSTILFRDEAGATFTIGLVGWLGPDPAKTSPRVMKAWSASMVSLLSPRLVGQPGHVSYTSLQTNWVGYPRTLSRSGTGYLYLGTNTVHLGGELVAEGRIQLTPQSQLVLPLREQVALRIAARTGEARRSGMEKGTDGIPEAGAPSAAWIPRSTERGRL